MAGILDKSCLAPAGLGIIFYGDFPSIFQFQRKRPLGNAKVRTNLFEKIPSRDGIFLQSDIFSLVGVFYEIYHQFEPIIALSLKRR
ncbi:MAG: hypothetical protein ABIG91_03105 [Patescibacteria group bacterium]